MRHTNRTPTRRASSFRLVGVATAVALVSTAFTSMTLSTLGCSSSGTTGDTTTSTGGAGGSASVTLRMPQLVRGAAYVDTTMFEAIPLRVLVEGDTPEQLEVTLDATKLTLTPTGAEAVADLVVAALEEGEHSLEVRALSGGVEVGRASGVLVTGKGSRQLTTFAKDGAAYAGRVVRDEATDQLVTTWIGTRDGVHRFYLRTMNGAFEPHAKADVVLNPESDEPLGGATAFGKDGVGVVYRTAKPGAAQWQVKLRVVDLEGHELVETQELTQGETAFTPLAAAADPGGYSAAWLHIRAPIGGAPQPVQVRYARWDTTLAALSEPLVLDEAEPEPMGSNQGEQKLEPLSELGLACSSTVCLVSYSKQIYNAFVDLNVAKLFVVRIDLATGEASAPSGVSLQDWDSQLFGQHLTALADGTFALIYTSVDTAAAVTPKSPCDTTFERDLLRLVRFDADGAQLGKPEVVVEHEGTRQYPRLAPHADGRFSLLWEDQRSYCVEDPGHIRMATSSLTPDGMLGEYRELPGSIGLPSEDPSIAPVNSNAFLQWSDNRNGDGLFDAKLELFADVLWSR